jgi:hypothetical protein
MELVIKGLLSYQISNDSIVEGAIDIIGRIEAE